MSERATTAYKLKLFMLFSVAYMILYVFPNFHPLWPAAVLPFTWIDQNVPFMPWTFGIYTSDYTIFFFVIMLIKDKAKFNSFARLLFATLFICGMFFLFFPTTYPRPVYPTLENSTLNFLMYLVGAADTPNNCFPSMHVALTCSATWGIRHKGPKYFWFFGIWSFLIILSTLTTKQHYFVDIVGGLAVSFFVGLSEHYFFQTGALQKWTGRVTA